MICVVKKYLYTSKTKYISYIFQITSCKNAIFWDIKKWSIYKFSGIKLYKY